MGRIIGNDEIKNAGRAKQAEADHEHDAQVLKDKVKKRILNPQPQAGQPLCKSAHS
jgi:uncharacterized protein YjbJ (UPF0337 family)